MTDVVIAGAARTPIGAFGAIAAELAAVGAATGIRPDVFEDAICNWQKHPDRYVRFSG